MQDKSFFGVIVELIMELLIRLISLATYCAFAIVIAVIVLLFRLVL